MKKTKARSLAICSMLFSLALGLSWLESAVAPLSGLPLGLKMGLANVVVLYALQCGNRTQALALVLLKAGFALLLRGPVAGALSFCGGLLSLFVMLLLMRLKKPGMLLLSVAGAVAHNTGQMLVIWLIFGASALVYLPMLLACSIIMGSLTAVLLRALPMHKHGGET